MIQPAVFTTALALAFAAVLAFVVFSGRLSPIWRRRCEIALRTLVVLGYLGLLVWGLLTVRTTGWFWLAMQPILWVWAFVTAVRARRRKAAADARQPGTFG